MVVVRNKKGLFRSPDLEVETFSDSKYEAKIVATRVEFEEVMRLRRDVFKNELGGENEGRTFADYDAYDARCFHLLVSEKESGNAVGTYRLNLFNGNRDDFYASNEFCLDRLPNEMLENAVELGRACIARDHRNSRVLFLLWRVMAAFMESTGNRFLFGCCSVFTQDPETAADVLEKLRSGGHVDDSIDVRPQPENKVLPDSYEPNPDQASIPPLVNIYMRIGAKVCGEPAIDREMRTVDYFVVFDLEEINRKYRKMFFGG